MIWLTRLLKKTGFRLLVTTDLSEKHGEEFLQRAAFEGVKPEALARSLIIQSLVKRRQRWVLPKETA